MLHLLKYSFLSKIRNFNIVFWPLVFPLVLGTFFYFAFGNINEADFQTVPVAVVKEASADTFFMTYLDEVEKSSPDLLKAEEMSEKEALEALQDKKVEGIYYVGRRYTPSGCQRCDIGLDPDRRAKSDKASIQAGHGDQCVKELHISVNGPAAKRDFPYQAVGT